MILSRFLKPKWQATDSEAAAPTAQDLESPDPALRLAALTIISDLEHLHGIAHDHADAALRQAAQERYLALWAGKDAAAPALAERLARMENAGRELLDFLLREAQEPELRLAALQRTDGASVLVSIAVHDPHLEMRLNALERIADAELLEQVARESRNRDKRVYRRARERLDLMAAAKNRAGHLERLCAEMENLQWDGESGLNAGRFPRLEQEWREQQQQEDAPPTLRQRYAAARSAFLAERQASAARRAQRLELLGTLETTLERLRQAAEPLATLESALQYATAEAPQIWVSFGVPQDAEGRRWEQQFQELSQSIQEQQRHLQRNQSRAAHLRTALRKADALLRQSSEVSEAELKKLRQHWESLERPESVALAADLQGQFDALLDKLRARMQRQGQEREREWEELQELAANLEAALENGELQQATTLHEQARQRLKRNIGLSKAQVAQVDERLQDCNGRINQLRDWRRWGTHQAREQLCVTAEGLVGMEAEAPEIARRIQETREAWRSLDRHEGAAPKALWKRFNSACERAYAPCQEYFAAQALQRQENLAHKVACCEQLEQLAQTAEWTKETWREVDRLRRRAQEHWYKLGPVNRAERKALDRRFQQALQNLDTHLDAERSREVQRREQLIAQVQALIEAPDLRAAVERAKQAQAHWHPTVQAAPRQEQALWKAFRSACDAVFARRQAAQQAVDAERQTNLTQRQELCATLEALLNVEGEQLKDAQRQVRTLRQQWESLGAAPKSEQRALEQRFESALRQFNAHQKSLQRSHAQETALQVQERTQLCARLEAMLSAAPADPTALSALQDEWEALPALADNVLQPLQQRFSASYAALADADAAAAQRATLERNLERKQVWCVCMEILAGVESPPQFAQQRMEYQVARLSASLAGAAAKGDAIYDPLLLQQHWWATGALPAEAAAALDTRFAQAYQTWQQQQ